MDSQSYPGRRTRIGDLTLQELRDEYHADLFDDYVPFWDKHGTDHEYGGFMCTLDHDGTQIDTNKNGWHQGRGLWVYSHLYNCFGDEEHLEIARKTKEFLLSHGRDENGDWAIQMDREGNILARDDVGYANMFVAEGLQEYARATGDDEVMDLAIKALYKGMDNFSAPEATRFKQAPASYPGIRGQGTHMVGLRVSTQMLRHSSEPTLQAFSDRMVDAIVDKFWNPEYGLNNEYLDHDYNRPDDANEDHIQLGHSMETLWMLMDEALRRKDDQLLSLAAERLHRHIQVAWDDVYDGFFTGMHVHGVANESKPLWTQEEVLVGALMLLEHTDLDWPEMWFARTYRYIKEKFSLRQYGYPLYILSGDRKVTFQPHVRRKGNYHRPRHLVMNLLTLDRMIAKLG
jgi:N-acylglucosamine 2-epimerase